MLKKLYFRHVLASKYPFHLTSFSRNCSRLQEVQGASSFLNLPLCDKNVEKTHSAHSGNKSTMYDPTIVILVS